MVLLCRFFLLPPSFFILAKALLRVDLGDGCTFGGGELTLEPCASEKDEERVGFALDGLGLTGLTVASVTDRETGDFGGGGLEAKKTRIHENSKKPEIRVGINS